MSVGRSEPLDYKGILDTIVNVSSDYLTKCGLKAMVLGLSGGLDSTVCAAICALVTKKTGIPLYGVSLTQTTSQNIILDSSSSMVMLVILIPLEIFGKQRYMDLPVICSKRSTRILLH